MGAEADTRLATRVRPCPAPPRFLFGRHSPGAASEVCGCCFAPEPHGRTGRTRRQSQTEADPALCSAGFPVLPSSAYGGALWSVSLLWWLEVEPGRPWEAVRVLADYRCVPVVIPPSPPKSR